MCASLDAYSRVTGLLVAGPGQREVLARTSSVTYSPAHVADMMTVASAAAAAAGSAGAPAGSVSPSSPVTLSVGGAAGGAGGATSPAGAAGTSAAGSHSPSSPGVISSVTAGPPPLTAAAAVALAAGFTLPSGVPAIAAAGAPPLTASDLDSAASSLAAAAADSAAAGGAAEGTFGPSGFETPDDRNVKPFRSMFTTPKEKSDNIEGRLQELSEAIHDTYEGLFVLNQPVGHKTTDTPVEYVGRIVTGTEGATADAKINAASVLLEASSSDAGVSSNTRVALDLSELPGYSLFPGQVVAVKGINPRGDKMIVQALYHGAPPPPAALPAANAAALAAVAAETDAAPLRIWAAAGPFCLQHELDFSPLQDLLLELEAASEPPDVLLLVRIRC